MSNNNKNNTTLSPEVAEKFIKIQEQELILRSQELELRKLHQQNNFEFAKASLNANITDQENDRKHQIQSKKITYIFAGGILILFIFFIIVALYLNKDEVVKEIIKAIIYISTSGVGGYYIGKNKNHQNEAS